MIEELLEAMNKKKDTEEEEDDIEDIKEKAIENEMSEFIEYVHKKDAKNACASFCTLFELFRGY